MNLTAKQIEQLQVIGKGENHTVDMDELVERVRYETSKESMQFSVRALIKKELIIKNVLSMRRGKMRVSYTLTELGKMYAGIRKSENANPAYIESDEEVIELDANF